MFFYCFFNLFLSCFKAFQGDSLPLEWGKPILRRGRHGGLPREQWRGRVWHAGVESSRVAKSLRMAKSMLKAL